MKDHLRIEPGDGNRWHGTTNGYTNRGCRCDDCKQAQHERYLETNTPAAREANALTQGLTCRVNGCERGQSDLGRALCWTHRNRFRRNGHTDLLKEHVTCPAPCGHRFGTYDGFTMCRECRVRVERTGTRFKRTTREWFLDHVDPLPDGHWAWTHRTQFRRNAKGKIRAPNYKWEGRTNQSIVRIIYQIVTGESRAYLRRTCGQYWCVNPEHLTSGRQSERTRLKGQP